MPAPPQPTPNGSALVPTYGSGPSGGPGTTYQDLTNWQPDLWTNVKPPTAPWITQSDRKGLSTQAYEWAPGTPDGYVTLDYKSIVEGTTPEQTYLWQKALESSGALTGGYARGTWDPKSKTALLKAMYTANKARMALSDMLGQSQMFKNAEDGGSQERYTGPTTTTSTNTSINLTARPTARAVLTAALQNELGREPSRREVDDFLRGLNIAERKNPSESTTTTTTDPDPKSHTVESSSTTTSKESKVNPSARAENFAEQVDPREAKRYQTGNYYAVIANMLGV
jgi:hypothetical protein